MNLLERFIKYVGFDTQSDENSDTFPSTLKQHALADFLVNELKEIGVSNAFKDEYGYVYGKIEGKKPQTIGFIAHMDTALEVTDENVRPNIIENYNGKDITLETGLQIKVSDFPFMKEFVGNTLVTTSGDTLLGADDKAGIAIIMTLAQKILESNEEYPSIFICFTPDEEIGDGAKYFNYDLFKVDFAYTLDGGPINVFNYENFNAASAKVIVNGKSIHPGEAKDKLINSINVAMEFDCLLPKQKRPEYTTMYEGFNHLNGIEGGVQQTELDYIIRNHDLSLLEVQKGEFKNAQEFLNKKYGEGTIELIIEDSYRNMKEFIVPHPEILELPKKALKMFGIDSVDYPIRGGTDGARLTYEGVLCPNLGTGSYNHHGAMEFANITEMNLFVDVLYTMLTKVA